MKKLLKLALVLVLVLGFSSMAKAQSNTSDTQDMTITINEIKVLEIISSAITLTIEAPETAGNNPSWGVDTTTLVQYSSVNTSGSTHKILAQLNVAPPNGTVLTLQPSAPANCGTAQGNAVLSNTVNREMISLIGNCKTGIGGSDGAGMTYIFSPEFSLENAIVMNAGTSAMIVTFTIL